MSDETYLIVIMQCVDPQLFVINYEDQTKILLILRNSINCCAKVFCFQLHVLIKNG